MRIRLLFFGVFICMLSSAKLKAQQSLWTKATSNRPDQSITSLKEISAAKYNLSKIDLTRLKNILRSAPLEKNNGQITEGISFSIPLPDETMLATSIAESPIWETKYAAQFSHLKTYVLTDPVTKSSQGRITVTAEGINGIIFSDKGTVYINPLPASDPGTHVSFYAQDEKMAMPACGSYGQGVSLNETQPTQRITAGDGNRRTYRLAVAATAEYTAWAGSQVNDITYITIAINNVIAVYDRDLNIRFTIVSPNSILFTNAATDPYPGGNVYLDDAATNANQTALDNIIGTAAYDLGIVFNHGWDRGYVPQPFGFVCNAASKGKGAAGVLSGHGQNPVAGPQGLSFDLTVAHEIGHQFGSTHSYASTVGTCAGFASAAATFEPGGGSTLMSYGGYPDCNTYVSYAEMYFHAGNIAQIQTYISGPGNCVTPTVTGNNAPVLTIAASSYTIPVSTPFTLTATGTDVNGNTLWYNWEQMDVNFLTPNPPAATNTGGPNFRSYPPTLTGNTRNFPKLIDIVNGTPHPYEVLPSVTRTLHFRLTARDKSPLGGATSEADVAVTCNSGAGPFTVTSQASIVTWAALSAQTITWNVASTNIAPVNCSLVDILFSTDGGITYPYTLVRNTSNDGTEIITAPNISTTTGRIKVQAVNNIFFNINGANVTIASTCFAEGATITPAVSIADGAGSPLLNLSLSPQYGTAFTPSGTITANNPTTFLTIYNSSISSCATYEFTGAHRYNIHNFTVTVPATYTFTRTASPSNVVFNLYRQSYDPSFPCNNFITSNCTTPPTTVNAAASAFLLPGQYVLVFGTFSATVPVVPFSYTVAISGGTIYTNVVNPGASFSYLYVIVDNATNLIKSIAATADLSNSATYPAGTDYTVYGLSYSNASPSLSGFIGTNFNTLKDALLFDASYCGNLSKNSLKVSALSSYTFIGNGNWSNPANWLAGQVPPNPIPSQVAVIINHPNGSECILDIPVTVSPGGKISLPPGKNFRVNANLLVQ